MVPAAVSATTPATVPPRLRSLMMAASTGTAVMDSATATNSTKALCGACVVPVPAYHFASSTVDPAPSSIGVTKPAAATNGTACGRRRSTPRSSS